MGVSWQGGHHAATHITPVLLVGAEGTELLMADARRPTQVKTCCVVNVGVVLSTLVATLVHTTAITRDIPGCENNMPYQLKAEWCFNPENKVDPPGPAQVVGSSLPPLRRTSKQGGCRPGEGALPASGTHWALPLSSSQILTNGLDSMFVIFCLLEFCTAVAALAFGYDAIRQHNYTCMVRETRGTGFRWATDSVTHPLPSSEGPPQGGGPWKSLCMTPKVGFSPFFLSQAP